MSEVSAREVIDRLLGDVAEVQELDLDGLSAKEAMAVAGALEVARRRLDHGTDRLAGHLDETGKHGVDGHKTAKAALKHVGRLPGAEAFVRLRTARALHILPTVAEAYEAGTIPTASMRAIGRVAANPRVRPFLDEVIDGLIAEQASTQHHDAFVEWLREFERLADADGADQDHARTHERRNARIVQNEADDSFEMRANTGALHGAAMAEIFALFEAAEWEADREAAIAEHGPDATPDQFPRTPAQRRADALLAIFRRAAATPADARSPEPLVSIIVDEETLETEVARASGDPDAQHDPQRLDQRICRTTSGHRLHPGDVLAALIVGQVRRTVIDSASNVIDLGRRSRCFTGSAREAAFLQAAIRDRRGTRCFWACDSPTQQVDHHEPWRRLGQSNVANSNIGCGHHNRLKEAGFRPVRRPDGGYDLIRPDGSKITPPV